MNETTIRDRLARLARFFTNRFTKHRFSVALITAMAVIATMANAQPTSLQDVPQPSVVLDEYIVDSTSYAIEPGSDTISLGTGPINLHLRWTLTQPRSRDTGFRYRLKGLSDDWHQAPAASEAMFIGLRAGNYEFQAQLQNASGDWADPVSQSFRVQRHIWQYRSLQLALLGLLLLAVGSFYHLRLKASRENQRRLEELVEQRTTELAHANRSLLQAATHDDLTGLANRSQVLARLDREWRRSTREQSSLAVLMLDLDQFKAYNDRYGHQAGDAALRAVAEIFQSFLRRSTDVIGRYGGEEFIGVLAKTDAEQALRLANAIVDAVRELGAENGTGLTVSVGIAVTIPTTDRGAPDQAVEEMVKAADQALYKIKRRGGDAAILQSDAGSQVVED